MEKGYGWSEAFYWVAQAVFETLPKESREKKTPRWIFKLERTNKTGSEKKQRPEEAWLNEGLGRDKENPDGS